MDKLERRCPFCSIKYSLWGCKDFEDCIKHTSSCMVSLCEREGISCPCTCPQCRGLCSHPFDDSNKSTPKRRKLTHNNRSAINTDIAELFSMACGLISECLSLVDVLNLAQTNKKGFERLKINVSQRGWFKVSGATMELPSRYKATRLCIDKFESSTIMTGITHLELRSARCDPLVELPDSIIHLKLTKFCGGELPSHLQVLELHECEFWDTTFPESLTSLTISRCDLIIHDEDRPKDSDYSLYMLPDFPSQLVSLSLLDCDSVEPIGLHLPSSLRQLKLDCKGIDINVDEWPSSLEILEIGHHAESNLWLPKNLRVLTIDSCEKLTRLILPLNLQQLRINLDNEDFPKVPKEKDLQCVSQHNRLLFGGPQLPETLTHLLLLGNWNSDISFSHLPPNLKVLAVPENYHHKLEFPSSLEFLTCSGHVFNSLPPNLKHVGIEDNYHFEYERPEFRLEIYDPVHYFYTTTYPFPIEL